MNQMESNICAQEVAYYQKVAPMLLPYLTNRRLTLARFPKTDYYYLHQRSTLPDAVLELMPTYPHPHYTENPPIICPNLTILEALVNLGRIGFMPDAAKLEHPSQPDWISWQLFGGEQTTTDQLFAIAESLTDYLSNKTGEIPYIKLSPLNGLDIALRNSHQTRYDESAHYARQIAETLAQKYAKRLHIIQTPENISQHKIGIYTGCNKPGHGFFAPYSLTGNNHSNPKIPQPSDKLFCSLPITLDELSNPEAFDEMAWPLDEILERLEKRLAVHNDLWQNLLSE